jgi:flagellar protein FliO/FliZ
MDMAMETARSERATVPSATSSQKTADAKPSQHDARVSQPESSAGVAAAMPGRADASAARAEAQPSDVASGGPTADSASVRTTAHTGTVTGIGQVASSTDVEADVKPIASTPDATAGAAPATANVVAATPALPTQTIATTQSTARPMPAASPADAGSLGGTVFALFLVVGLILALGWLAKRMPGFGRGASNNGLRMVASLPIGARERVVVVEVGSTQLLLGVGPGGTRTLHTLDTPLPEAGPAQAPQFAQLLAQHFGKKA